MDTTRGSWTGAMKQAWNWGDWVWSNATNDLVPMNYGWGRGQPSPPPPDGVGNDHDSHVSIRQALSEKMPG